MNRILDTVRSFDGVLVLQPGPGSGFPELAWGDSFFYVAPDGRIPERTQPYGTIITKDYPDDTASRLDDPDRWRVNIHVDRATFRALTRVPSGASAPGPTAADVVLPHPVYAAQSWVCVVNPGERTLETVLDLLRHAHDAARGRRERREAVGG